MFIIVEILLNTNIFYIKLFIILYDCTINNYYLHDYL